MIRWILEDPVTTAVWTLPRNPYAMDSPVVPHRTSVMPGGLAFRKGATSIPWSFKIRLKTQAEYEQMLAWSQVPNSILITDHLGRVHRVVPLHFDPASKRSRHEQHWRFDATFKALYVRRETP
jgi:hypothetical protein